MAGLSDRMREVVDEVCGEFSPEVDRLSEGALRVPHLVLDLIEGFGRGKEGPPRSRGPIRRRLHDWKRSLQQEVMHHVQSQLPTETNLHGLVHPLERDRYLVEEGLPDGLEGSTSVVEAVRHGFREKLLDRLTALIDEHVTAICESSDPGPQRQARLQECFVECLDAGMDVFWGVLQAVNRVPLHVNPQNPLEYLQRNEDLSLAFIHAVQSHPRQAEIYPDIEQRCLQSAHLRAPNRFFRGAAIPTPRPLFETFARQCNRPESRAGVFDHLIAFIHEQVKRETHDKQRAYPIPGAHFGWLALLSLLENEQFSNPRVYSTTAEYLPMLDHGQLSCIVPGESEEEIAANLVDSIQANQAEETQPIVFLATVLRTGRRRDVNRIRELVLAQCPEAFFVFDAAQDHYLYPDADAVLYSKQFGGSGTGILMLSKRKGGQSSVRVAGGVHRRSRAQRSLDLEQLAKTAAAFRAERAKVHWASPLKDLLTTASLWRFSGHGQYIDRQASRIEEFVGADPFLSQHFEVEYSEEAPDEANRNPWKASRVVLLRRRPDSAINLQEFVARLQGPSGLQVDWYDLASVERFNSLLALSSQPYSEEHARKFFNQILRFQRDTRATYLLEMLSLPEVFNDPQNVSEELYRRQGEVLRNALARQTLIRLQIDVSHNEQDIGSLLAELSRAGREMAGTARDAA